MRPSVNVLLALATACGLLACDRGGGGGASGADGPPPRMNAGAGANQSTSPHTGAPDGGGVARAAVDEAADVPRDAAPGAPADDSLVGEERERDPRSDTIRVKVQVDQRRQAHVYWGRKDFGVAPLEIERPRNSGPLDLVVIAPGYLPYHARAFTDRDDVISVHLYTATEAPQLLGYRASEVPAASASGPSVSAPSANQNHPKTR